ncbi:hypothetical protein NE237_030473 [Protea cynaroides]|uniref:Uncharacterized protein n=1 Tax=Protea cynaroides TaxID=273540 RepID=A0A9Q0JVU0_9MAGN|nr:hypothetical protein NE237_030473 [Protea cynaroides]
MLHLLAPFFFSFFFHSISLSLSVPLALSIYLYYSSSLFLSASSLCFATLSLWRYLLALVTLNLSCSLCLLPSLCCIDLSGSPFRFSNASCSRLSLLRPCEPLSGYNCSQCPWECEVHNIPTWLLSA